MKIKQTILFGVLALLGGFIGGILSDGLPGKAVAKSDVEKVSEVGDKIDKDNLIPDKEYEAKKILRAERIELVDENGIERASLFTFGPETLFTIGHPTHGDYLEIRHDPKGVGLHLGSWDKTHVHLVSSQKSGTNISFSKKTWFNDRLELGVSDDGNPILQLYDEKEQTCLVLGKVELKNTKTGSTEIRSTGSIVIFDEEGKVVYSVP
jgi:hypothetical protein